VLCKAAYRKCVDKAQPHVYFCPADQSANLLSRLMLLDCCSLSIGDAVRLLQALDVIERSA